MSEDKTAKVSDTPDEPQGIKLKFAKAFSEHPFLLGATCAFAVIACVCLLFWYIAFSGISSSAEFIYSNF